MCRNWDVSFTIIFWIFDYGLISACVDRFTTLWPFNSMGQRHKKRADNLVVTFHSASHKLLVSMQVCDHFPGTEQYRVQCCKAVLWGWGMGPHLAGSSKIWNFESQSMARDKKENCGVSPADSLNTDRLRAGI